MMATLSSLTFTSVGAPLFSLIYCRYTAEEYIMALYDLVESCDYGDDIRDEMIRDRLVVGIRDSALSQKL